jgi:hypothetical protein
MACDEAPTVDEPIRGFISLKEVFAGVTHVISKPLVAKSGGSRRFRVHRLGCTTSKKN